MDLSSSAPRAALRRLRAGVARLRRASAAPVDDGFDPSPPLECRPAEVERWNAEWLRYLGREWEVQLAPHTDYPDTPPLPDQPDGLLDLRFGRGPPLQAYCDREALEGRRVMELGCGCGNMGKLLGRYVDTYLGVDYSTLALGVARLVSPSNCDYVHVGDRAGLEPWFGTIDTVLGRFFWIHQNHQLATWNLEFLARFLRPGGRLYADFFWRDPDRTQNKVFTPDQPLSRAYPSAMFEYAEEDVARLLEGQPFTVLREETSKRMQRRYVVLERAPS